MLEANFWQDKSNSQKVVKEKKFFEDLINSLNSSVEKLNDFEDLNELALEENNSDVQGEIIQNIKQLRLEIKLLLMVYLKMIMTLQMLVNTLQPNNGTMLLIMGLQ